MRPVLWRECICRKSSIPPRRASNHHKGDRHLCGGFGVCPDETCQNEPVTRRGNGVGREFGLLNRVPTWATYRLWKTLLSDYGECCCRIMTCATTAYGNVPHERRHGASCHRHWSRAQTWCKSVLRSVAASPDVTPSSDRASRLSRPLSPWRAARARGASPPSGPACPRARRSPRRPRPRRRRAAGTTAPRSP